MANNEEKKSITPRVVTDLHHLKDNFIYGAYLLAVEDFEISEDTREASGTRISMSQKHFDQYVLPLEKRYGSQAKAVKAVFQYLEKHPELTTHTVNLPE